MADVVGHPMPSRVVLSVVDAPRALERRDTIMSRYRTGALLVGAS
jgi:hypothetical protein